MELAFLFSLLSLVAQVLLLLSLLILSYRIGFHPLKSFPGPIGARVTSAYSFWYIWHRNFHTACLHLHKKYGSVVRVAPNRLVFSSVTALQDIYNNPRVTKGHAYVQLRAEINATPNLLNTLDRETHRQKRRIIAPVVSDRSMRVFEQQMSQQIDVFLRLLLKSSQQNEVVNMSPRCERLGVDIVGQLAFGYQLDTQTDPTHRAVVDGIKLRGARGTLYYFWERLRAFNWMVDRMLGWKDIDGFYRSLRTMIEARMTIPKNAKHDFYALASGEISPGEPGLIGKDLWAEAVFFIAAGGSTTATAMSGVFFYLSRNPGAYERLAKEIRTTFVTGRDIFHGPQLNSCKYLRAVTDETMRMSPSTLAVAWREQNPSSVATGESFVVDGHVIPPGTQVGLSNYSLQHGPKYFPDPFTFRPERWLASESDVPETAEQKDVIASMRRAFAPFSIGERNCAGKPMAYLEMTLVVARTLWYFDFTKAPGTAGKLGGGTPGSKNGREKPGEFQLYEGVVVGHDGPNLVFSPRSACFEDLV
ncbi:cytochrome P450 [Byssothecium circinans]|uniref:Cytochrome P450 n=1 Tax=Byssothecium circinans TaxID=147558 RepID=A0A6A5TBX4_9PLEO|nr:cytochrome P450 [Byssothecium circinans]